jgi:hypothetical protein
MFPIKSSKTAAERGKFILNKGDFTGKISKEAGLTKSQAEAALTP